MGCSEYLYLFILLKYPNIYIYNIILTDIEAAPIGISCLRCYRELFAENTYSILHIVGKLRG
jgi:hypothetical protein